VWILAKEPADAVLEEVMDEKFVFHARNI